MAARGIMLLGKQRNKRCSRVYNIPRTENYVGNEVFRRISLPRFFWYFFKKYFFEDFHNSFYYPKSGISKFAQSDGVACPAGTYMTVIAALKK